MKSLSNATFTAGSGVTWNERLLARQRRKLFDAFMLFRQGGAEDSVLDVGLRSDVLSDHPFVAAPARSLVTSCAVDPAGTGLHLPWPDASFDWVFCGEVIEHAGSSMQQQALTAECYRVARKGVFITTPNRLHPLEFNSGLPFVHWLSVFWRQRLAGLGGRIRRVPPAMLDAAQLYALVPSLPGSPAHDVGHKRVFGIKAHFFLMISKEA